MKAGGGASGSRVSQVWTWDGQKGEKEAWTATLLLTTVIQIHVPFLEDISNCSGTEGQMSLCKMSLYSEEGTAAYSLCEEQCLKSSDSTAS